MPPTTMNRLVTAAKSSLIAQLVATTTLALVFVAAAIFFAPLTASCAIPLLLWITVHHAQAIARTTGSPKPFIALCGLDILLLVIVLASSISHL